MISLLFLPLLWSWSCVQRVAASVRAGRSSSFVIMFRCLLQAQRLHQATCLLQSSLRCLVWTHGFVLMFSTIHATADSLAIIIHRFSRRNPKRPRDKGTLQILHFFVVSFLFLQHKTNVLPYRRTLRRLQMCLPHPQHRPVPPRESTGSRRRGASSLRRICVCAALASALMGLVPETRLIGREVASKRSKGASSCDRGLRRALAGLNSGEPPIIMVVRHEILEPD